MTPKVPCDICSFVSEPAAICYCNYYIYNNYYNTLTTNTATTNLTIILTTTTADGSISHTLSDLTHRIMAHSATPVSKQCSTNQCINTTNKQSEE